MPTPNYLQRPATLPRQASGFSPARTAKTTWKLLPITWLENFERIDTQFAIFGFHFSDAIALQPSNPKFSAMGDRQVIMPERQGRQMQIDLQQSPPRMHLWFLSSQSVTVSALNEQGNCVAMAKTQASPMRDSQQRYGEQNIIIATHNATSLRITSRAPFVMTQLTWEAVQSL